MNHSPATPSDRQLLELELLVTRCQLGEPEGFAALVARFHEPLWGYVSATVGDPDVAEEVLQEGWLRLRGIQHLRDARRLRSWLFTIVRNTFMDRLRTRYAEEQLEPLEVDLPAESQDQLAWDDLERLQAAVGRLPSPDREATVLFYLHELDLREVAEVLSVPVGTVKSRLHRSRQRLRQELQPEGDS